MPTLREVWDRAIAQGVPVDQLKARAQQLGVGKDDLDLDYEVAKQKGQERLRAPAAPAPVAAAPAFAPTPTSPEDDAANAGSTERQDLTQKPAVPKLAGGLLMHPNEEVLQHLPGLLKGAYHVLANDQHTPGEQAAHDKLPWQTKLHNFATGQGIYRSKAIDEAQHATEQDVQDRLKPNHSDVGNVLSDLGDVLMVFPHLAGTILLPKHVDDKHTLEQVGRETGKELTAGMVGGTEGILHHPIDSAIARPFTTLTTVAPVFDGVKNLLGAAPGVPAATAAVAGGSRALSAALWERVPYAVKRAVPAEKIASTMRFLVDGYHQRDPRATAIVEKILREPDRNASVIVDKAGRAAKRVERGEVKPEIAQDIAQQQQEAGVRQDTHAQAVAEYESAKQSREALAAHVDELEQRAKNQPQPTGRFHGTSSRLPGVLDNYHGGSEKNIYGQGMYTTDSHEIARGYSKKGRGGTPSIYDVQAKDVPLYDLEQPMPPDVRDMLRNTHDFIRSEIDPALLDNPNATLRDVYDHIRHNSQESASAIQEMFDAIRSNLEDRGFRGFRHVGGKSTGKAPHDVRIYWYPEDDVVHTLRPDMPPDPALASAKARLASMPEPVHPGELPSMPEAPERLRPHVQYDEPNSLREIGRVRVEADQARVAQEGPARARLLAKYPEFAKDVDEIAHDFARSVAEPNLAQGEAAREAILAEHPEQAPELAQAQDERWRRTADDPALHEHAAEALVRVLDDQSIGLLRHPEFRRQVAETVADRLRASKPEMPGFDRTKLIGDVDYYLHEAESRGIEANRMPTFSVGGELIDVASVAEELAGKLALKSRAEVLRLAASDLAHEVQLQGLKRGLAQEADRYRATPADQVDAGLPEPPPTDPARTHARNQERIRDLYAPDGELAEKSHLPTQEQVDYAKHATRAVQKGGMRPQVLPEGWQPVDMKAAFNWHSKWAESSGLPEEAHIAQQLAKDVWNYKQLPEDLDGGFKGHLSPGFRETIAYDRRARIGVQDSLVRSITSAMKANLTSGNPVSAINNFAANMMLAVIRRGVDPFSYSARAAYQYGEYSKFRRGLPFNPKYERVFRAIQDTGLLDTDAVKMDIGEDHGPVLPVPGLREGMQAINRGLTGIYRFGDNFFKLEEAVHNFDTLDGYSKALRPGQEMEVQITPRARVTIAKTADGYQLRDTTGRGPATSAPVDVQPGSQLDAVLAKAAGKKALDLMFDYSDTSNFVKWLKQAPVVGMASPFFTWTWKSMDIPGFKKGLGYEMMAQPLSVRTTSPQVAMMQLGEAAKISTARSAMLGAVRTDILSHKNAELTEMIARAPADVRLYWTQALSDPRYIGYWSYANWNPLKPSEALFRIAAGAYEMATRPDIQGMPLEKQREILRTNELMRMADQGQLVSGKHVLELIGAAGSPLTDALAYAKESAQQGKHVTAQQIMQKFAASFMGGFYSKALDVGVGAVAPNSIFTTRGSALTLDSVTSEPFFRWAVRKFTGMGWQVKDVALNVDPRSAGSFLNQAQAEWLDSLGVKRSLKAGTRDYLAAKAANDSAALQAAREQIASAKRLAALVKGEIKTMYRDYYHMAKAMSVKGLPEPDEAFPQEQEQPDE